MVLGFAESSTRISEALGVVPTRTWRAGEPVAPGAANRQPTNGWLVTSPVDPVNPDPDEAVTKVLNLIPDGAFGRLPTDADVQLSVTIYGHRERPSLYLSNRTLAMLAAIRASLDVDTYDLSEVDSEKE